MLSIPKFVGLGLALASFPQDAIASPHRRASSSGCSSTTSWTFDSSNHRTQTHSDGRSYLIHTPATFNPAISHALVLSFHGNGGSSAGQETESALSAAGLLIDGKGIIVVYPQALKGTGKLGAAPSTSWEGAPYANTTIDDIAFTSSIIDEVEANLCIDTSRVYITGKSNGGGFTNLLACTPSISSRIAAFASASAALYSGTHPFSPECTLGTRTVPYISTHGTADTTIPYDGRTNLDGDTAYATPDVDDWRKAWAVRNGCPETPSQVTTPYANTTRYEWACAKGATVVGLTVQGLGHSWVKTQFNADLDEIIPFFQANPLA